MSSAVQRRDTTEVLDFEATAEPARQIPGTESALKQAVAERLAAHRSRRAAEQEQAAQVNQRQGSGSPSQRASARVRDAVAARYQQSVSYREFLAVEAERALQQAQAEAEVATRNARAVAEAKIQLMEEIEQWNRSESSEETSGELSDIARDSRELIREDALDAEVSRERASSGLSIQLYEDVPVPTVAWTRQTTEIDESEE